jgi:hypothetical protein
VHTAHGGAVRDRRRLPWGRFQAVRCRSSSSSRAASCACRERLGPRPARLQEERSWDRGLHQRPRQLYADLHSLPLLTFDGSRIADSAAAETPAMLLCRLGEPVPPARGPCVPSAMVQEKKNRRTAARQSPRQTKSPSRCGRVAPHGQHQPSPESHTTTEQKIARRKISLLVRMSPP